MKIRHNKEHKLNCNKYINPAMYVGLQPTGLSNGLLLTILQVNNWCLLIVVFSSSFVNYNDTFSTFMFIQTIFCTALPLHSFTLSSWTAEVDNSN